MSNGRDEARRKYDEMDTDERGDVDGAHDAAHRSTQQQLWIDIQVRQAMRQGAFDNLPGSGKPIDGLGQTHDPDWWAKQLVQREQITGLGPPAIMLRKEDAELDGRLDRENTEAGVRRIVEDFNGRVVEARRQLLGGPPVITATRDVDEQVEAWRRRRDERRAAQRRAVASAKDSAAVHGAKPRRWRAWWSRR